jgi:hypothetical protein
LRPAWAQEQVMAEPPIRSEGRAWHQPRRSTTDADRLRIHGPLHPASWLTRLVRRLFTR